MAKNIVRSFTPVRLSVACTHPATPLSGDPVRYGELTGVALTKEGEGQNSATNATVDLGIFEVKISVRGIDGVGNSAVAEGDRLYYTDADTPPVSKKATGRIWGYALGTVTSGGTATIATLHTND